MRRIMDMGMGLGADLADPGMRHLAVPAMDDARNPHYFAAIFRPLGNAYEQARGTQVLAPLEAARTAGPTGEMARQLATDGITRLRSHDEVARDLDLLTRGILNGPDERTSRVGVSGPLRKVELRDPDGEGRITAIIKPEAPTAEVLGFDVARVMGIDHLATPTVRGPDGEARMRFAPGVALSGIGADSFEGAARLLAGGYERAGIGPAEAAARGQLDVELVAAFDHVLGNIDRHGGNAIADARRGMLQLIDHGHAGMGLAHLPDARVVPLNPMLQPIGARARMDEGRAMRVVLSEPARAHLTGIRPQALSDAWDAARSVPGQVTADGMPLRHDAVVRSPSFRDGMLARLGALQERGWYDLLH